MGVVRKWCGGVGSGIMVPKRKRKKKWYTRGRRKEAEVENSIFGNEKRGKYSLGKTVSSRKDQLGKITTLNSTNLNFISPLQPICFPLR